MLQPTLGVSSLTWAALRGGSFSPGGRSLAADLHSEQKTMTTEEFTLLRKAAADPKGQIALKRDPDGAWPSDRTSFQALSDRGLVLALGESMGPHIGGTFAVWRITPQGRAVIGEPL